MSDKNNLASSILAALKPFTGFHLEDSPSALSVQTGIVVFAWAANEYYTSAPSTEAKTARAEEIQQLVTGFKLAHGVDGCPSGYHPVGDVCVPDNR